MKIKPLLLSTAVLALLAIMPAVARADAVLFNGPASVTIQAGSSLNLSGSLTNPGMTQVFINGISTTSNVLGITLDDSIFLGNAPATIAAGATSSIFDFFTITVSNLVAPGTYNSAISFTVQGGANDSTLASLGTFDLQVVVTAATQVVPEPASMLLLGSGLGGMFLARRRRKQKLAS